MSDIPTTARQRDSEDPWSLALRILHDLARDGVRILYPERIALAVPLCAEILETLGIKASAPEE